MQSPSNSQKKAIQHGKGPMLVMAGPGSGKTFVIIQRILNLIREYQVRPDNILVISFSKASALELKQRFQKQNKENPHLQALSESQHNYNSINNGLNKSQHNYHSVNYPSKESQHNYNWDNKLSNAEKTEVNFATFHACFFHILKETYHYTSKDIITEKQKRDILKSILSDPQYEDTDRNGEESNRKKYIKEEKDNRIVSDERKNISEKTEDYLQKISYYKNRGVKELKEKENLKFQNIYYAYNQEMHRQHKLDFDDMGLLCLQLFQNKLEVLERWQDKFRYILIDEFQDINRIQFRIVQLLAKKYRNLFVVGDDDQAIYGFRGSDPQIMLDFETYYPDTQKVLLETNYRCSTGIVKEALKVIEQNKVRFPKKIRTVEENVKENTKSKNPDSVNGNQEDVIYKSFENYYKEYLYIGEQIQNLVNNQICGYSDIACIFRTNQDMMGLAGVFIRKKIPFVMKESSSSIFKHMAAQDLLAYLQFFLEGKKRKDFIRIMNKPLRYLSRNAICFKDNDTIVWGDLKRYYSSKRYIVNHIEQLEKNDHLIQKLDLYGACFYIRNVIGYDDYLKEYTKEQGINWEETKEILDYIQESTRNRSSLEEWKEYIEQWEEALKNSAEEKEGVHIITMHACKGLEYQRVFLPDCNEGKVPHKKAASPEEIEEERRMFYVAMTRAKKHLEILYIEDERKKHIQITRFIQHKLKENNRMWGR